MVILSHPSGNANVRAVACGLREAGILSKFRTGIASFPGSMLDKLGGIGPLAEIRRRRFDPLLEPVTQTWPWFEAGRLLASRAGFSNLTKHEKGIFSVDAVYQNFDRKVAASLRRAKWEGVKAVYAYEDGAMESFMKAKSQNLKCIYDLPIGYWRAAHRLLGQERLDKPEWASTLTGFQNSDAKLARKDEELRLADQIFVASQFTASTLKEFPGNLPLIEVIPYGFPPVLKQRKYSSYFDAKPLKILFVGGLSQRKGIADLFAAVEVLKQHVQLTVVGRKGIHPCAALDVALSKHRWIPSLPHAEILKLMQEHDVLVFPSLFEGFGLVITEAMSQGTPVITTDRTAGPDLIEHDQNGWIVEAGSSNAIFIAIEKLLSNRKKVAEAGKAAMETARQRPWEVYGRELSEAILKGQKN